VTEIQGECLVRNVAGLVLFDIVKRSETEPEPTRAVAWLENGSVAEIIMGFQSRSVSVWAGCRLYMETR
jgi:hypothetical protein